MSSYCDIHSTLRHSSRVYFINQARLSTLSLSCVCFCYGRGGGGGGDGGSFRVATLSAKDTHRSSKMRYYNSCETTRTQQTHNFLATATDDNVSADCRSPKPPTEHTRPPNLLPQLKQTIFPDTTSSFSAKVRIEFLITITLCFYSNVLSGKPLPIGLMPTQPTVNLPKMWCLSAAICSTIRCSNYLRVDAWRVIADPARCCAEKSVGGEAIICNRDNTKSTFRVSISRKCANFIANWGRFDGPFWLIYTDCVGPSTTTTTTSFG